MFRIVLKDLRLFITDRRAVMMTFVMPIALISIFAMAYGGARERNARPVTLIVTDLDQSDISKSIITQLDSLKNIEVHRMALDSAEHLVKIGEESSVLVFGKGFGDSVKTAMHFPLDLRYDEAKGAEIGILQQAISGNVMRMIGLTKMKLYGALPDTTGVKAGAGKAPGGNDESPLMKLTPLIEEKQGNLGLIQAVAGTSVMMLLFGLAIMGASLLEEKETGTLKKLLYSPIRVTDILYGKVLAGIITALVQLTVLYLFAAYMFKLDLLKNLPALITMMVTTAFACAGFGMFLASVARSRQQVQMLSTLTVLSMSAIGGSMVPSFIMPAAMQKVSMFTVNYWSIQGFYDIYWRNLAFTDPQFLMRPLMLVLIGLVMITISTVLFKRNVLKIA